VRSRSNRGWRISVMLALVCAACGGGPSASSIDLVGALPSAEKHALGLPDEAIRATVVSRDQIERPAIVTGAPSRVLFPIRLPARARFHTAISLVAGTGVTIRVGISDNRSYDELQKLLVAPSTTGAVPWHTLDIDLAPYSGFQWSLFYRPGNMTWRLVFNADATPGGRVAWLEPKIEMR
jgi:hypothetical protein